MVLEENRSLAEHALKIIQEIYRTEHFADSKEYTPEERRELRNRQSAPLCWIPLKSGWKAHILHIPADTRSAFPVISVHSPVSIQCRWQS